MKLTVFGSTGGVGQHVVAQVLEAGHAVTAFTRKPAMMTQSHPDLTVMRGDVLDPVAVQRAVAGQDVVICTLGMPLLNNDRLRTCGTANIVAAMEAVDVKRLVCLSSLGVSESRALLPLLYKILIFPTVMKRLLVDHAGQEALIAQSSLDWTVVRPGNFTRGERTGNYAHGFTPPDADLSFKISRSDVADFILRQLSDDTYRKRAPALSYRKAGSRPVTRETPVCAGDAR